MIFALTENSDLSHQIAIIHAASKGKKTYLYTLKNTKKVLELTSLAATKKLII